jgi:hypothetical protein
MEPIDSRTKCYRTETAPDRETASAMWRRAKILGLPVRGWMDGDKCRVQVRCTEWTLWRICNHARMEVKRAAEAEQAAQAAALVAQAKAEIAASVPEYFDDDGWADDAPILGDERALEGDDAGFITGIYDAARTAGYQADWCRVAGHGSRWRVEVWGVTEREFRALLDVAGQAVKVAA